MTDTGVETTVAIVLLAAGTSSRMGEGGLHKLLARFGGIPLVRRSAMIALTCRSSSVTVVTGYRDADIREAVAGLEVGIAHNHDYRSGMATSICAGVGVAQRAGPDGIMVMLADMPALGSADLDCLIAEFRAAGGKSIVRAMAQGAPGNPVIFPRSVYPALLTLHGDEGARKLINRYGLPVIDVEIGDGARVDVDTPEQIVAAGGVVNQP